MQLIVMGPRRQYPMLPGLNGLQSIPPSDWAMHRDELGRRFGEDFIRLACGGAMKNNGKVSFEVEEVVDEREDRTVVYSSRLILTWE